MGEDVGLSVHFRVQSVERYIGLYRAKQGHRGLFRVRGLSRTVWNSGSMSFVCVAFGVPGIWGSRAPNSNREKIVASVRLEKINCRRRVDPHPLMVV